MKVKGFTLVELLVVTSIMGVLAIVSFAKYATLKEDQFLKAAANELQSLIRTAQTNATTSVKCGLAGGVPWFVEFQTSKKEMQIKCLASAGPPEVKNSVKTLELSNNIEVESITYSACSSSALGSSIVSTKFDPLTGKVTFTDSGCIGSSLPNSSTMTITLKKIGGTDTKSVTLTKGGSVEIN